MVFRHKYIASIASVKKEPSILFFDIEMTGGNIEHDEILQLSIVDMKKGKVFNEYIRPIRCQSWKETESIHHITPKMVKNCATINSFRYDIRKIFSQADIIVGYGIDNDLNFMRKDRLFVGKNTIIYDLQKSFSRICSSNNELLGLLNCAKYCACPPLGKVHNSLTDAYMTAYCFTTLFGLGLPSWINDIAYHNVHIK